ncbi:MAG TPA: endopeptidase La, partial [Eubacteriaceae bacterium]|nr:endopeptidase La [Eubacteriaceae bacterium]
TLQVEAVAVQGKGQIELTGKLGDVMKESAKTGISYIRSIADQLKIDPEFYKNNDIHLHVPEGAIPKDGPSAGITITTAVISVLTKEPVTQNLAMTGEITLRGRVLPIGGLKEKLLAAHRAGISQIIIPADNNKDLEEIPEEILKKLTIHQVSSMQEVIDLVFNGGLK